MSRKIHQKRRSKKVKSNDSFDEDTQIQSAVGQIVVHFPKRSLIKSRTTNMIVFIPPNNISKLYKAIKDQLKDLSVDFKYAPAKLTYGKT